ncbi:MAG: glycosyltransferase family 39 protein [Alphaproteobacteria bacterium]
MTAAGGGGPALGRLGYGPWLALYIVLFFGLHLAFVHAAGVDDVAETIFAQSLQWSYWERQPPLYTWLLWAVYQTAGVSVVSLFLLRYALVTVILVFYYLCARRLVADRRLVLLTAFSPLLIYSIGWSAHVGFSNTMVLMAAIMGSFYAFLRIAQDGSAGAYAGFGAGIAAGLLAKYGFLVFILSLLAAAVLDGALRRRIFHPRMLLAVAAAALLAGPYLLFGFEGMERVQPVFNSAMNQYHAESYLANVGRGFARLFVAVTMFLSPFIVIALAAFPRAILDGRTGAPDGFDARRLFERFFVIVLAILVVGILFGGVDNYKSRWMHPMLMLAPLYFFTLVERAGHTARQARFYGGAILVATVLVAVVFVGQVTVGPPFCKRCRLLVPYVELAQQVRQAGFAGGTIVASDEHLAGNLRLLLAPARVASLGYPFYLPPGPSGAGGQCLVAWNARLGDEVPSRMMRFLEESFGVRLESNTPTGFLSATHRSSRDATIRIGYVLLDPGQGRCR